jgi:hypothetical protein
MREKVKGDTLCLKFIAIMGYNGRENRKERERDKKILINTQWLGKGVLFEEIEREVDNKEG